jgi:hypothetical protein
MNGKNIRKYNTIFRKKLVENLDKINNNQILVDIYNIIVEDIGHNYSVNRNGLFINLNILSDFCINKLINIINSYKEIDNSKNTDNYNYNNYKFDDIELINELGHKLTNQEKILIKKIKKPLN